MKTKTNKTVTSKSTTGIEGLGSESDRQFVPSAEQEQSKPADPTPQASPEPPRSPRADRPPLDWQKRSHNRNLPVPEVLALIRAEAPDLYPVAQVVGRWIWIQFPDRQPPTITGQLSQLGFHWNNKRQVWQHPCGPITVDASPEDPRAKYGVTPAVDVAF